MHDPIKRALYYKLKGSRIVEQLISPDRAQIHDLSMDLNDDIAEVHKKIKPDNFIWHDPWSFTLLDNLDQLYKTGRKISSSTYNGYRLKCLKELHPLTDKQKTQSINSVCQVLFFTTLKHKKWSMLSLYKQNIKSLYDFDDNKAFLVPTLSNQKVLIVAQDKRQAYFKLKTIHAMDNSLPVESKNFPFDDFQKIQGQIQSVQRKEVKHIAGIKKYIKPN